MQEKTVEACLRKAVKELNGIAYKFVSPGNNGVPDRLILLPGGKAVFAETKAPGKTSTPLQIMQQGRISRLGFVVCVIDSIPGVDEFLQEVIRL